MQKLRARLGPPGKFPELIARRRPGKKAMKRARIFFIVSYLVQTAYRSPLAA